MCDVLVESVMMDGGRLSCLRVLPDPLGQYMITGELLPGSFHVACTCLRNSIALGEDLSIIMVHPSCPANDWSRMPLSSSTTAVLWIGQPDRHVAAPSM